MSQSSHILIARPINGISLNGREYLLDEENKEMEFKDKESAKQFLRDNGYENFSDEELEDSFDFIEEKH
jgi:hypothetical protein